MNLLKTALDKLYLYKVCSIGVTLLSLQMSSNVLA